MKDGVGGRKAAWRPCLLTDLPSAGRGGGGGRDHSCPQMWRDRDGYLARVHHSRCGFLSLFGGFFEHTRPRAEALLRGEPSSQFGLRPTLAYRGEKEFPYH